MKLTNILLVSYKQYEGLPIVWRSLSHIKALDPLVYDYRIIAEYMDEENKRVVVAGNLNNHEFNGCSYRYQIFYEGELSASFQDIEKDFRNPANNFDIRPNSLMMVVSFAMYSLKKDSVFS
jgi:hypothetical protein